MKLLEYSKFAFFTGTNVLSTAESDGGNGGE